MKDRKIKLDKKSEMSVSILSNELIEKIKKEYNVSSITDDIVIKFFEDVLREAAIKSKK
jgi:hypothetical protein